MKNKYLFALAGVALAFGAGMYLAQRKKDTTSKPCSCNDDKMANAAGKLVAKPATKCRVCEGPDGVGYYSSNGTCRTGHTCRN